MKFYFNVIRFAFIDFFNRKPYSKEYIPIMTEVVKDFEREEFKKLNRGGCGIFAYNLGRILKKKNIPFQLLWFKSESHEKHHILIEVGGIFLDSQGIYGLSSLNFSGLQKSHYVTMKELLEDNKSGSWNKEFDRTLSTNVRHAVENCYNKVNLLE
jgi:hypothetical protein